MSTTATERQLDGTVRFAFRYFPLTGIHPHALAAATAAEAAARQGRFWDVHEQLFHRQKALGDSDLFRSTARTADLGEGSAGDEPQCPRTTSPGIHRGRAR